MSSPPGHDRLPLLGSTLGGYTLVRELGRGGMGAVYVGEHARIVRRAAVKVLLDGSAESPEAVQRFFAEARAASMIRHAGIVEVFDCDVDPGGTAFIVMEHLEGSPLSRLIADGGAADVAIVANVGAQVANAMAAAHERGILHRDLKPDNIFLCPDPAAGPGGRVKILDFGIAKLLAAADAPGLTAEGFVMGTPRYMSPEQCKGSRTIGPACDIYSLGCILFQMACGQPPFVRDTSTALLVAHLTEAPAHPSSLAPGLPADLDALILEMLAKAPEARPSGMQEVERRLRGLRGAAASGTAAAVAAAPAPTVVEAATRTRLSAPAPSTTPVSPPKPGRGWPVLAAGLVLLGLTSVAGVLVVKARAARQAEAQAARARLDELLARAGEVPAPPTCQTTDRGTLVGLASAAESLEPAGGDPTRGAPRLQRSDPQAAEEWAMRARLELLAAHDAQALAAAERALAHCPAYAAAHYLAGKAADRLGQRDKALAEYRLAVAGQGGFMPPRYNLALLLLKGGDSAGAAATLDEVVAWGPDARARLLRAQARLNLGQLAGAEADLREVVRLEPRLADGWALLGTVEARKGDVQEATRAFCRAKELGSAAAAANCPE